MLPLPQQGEPKAQGPNRVHDWIRTTSVKILAIGAGLREFLRFTEKIVFSKEPSHVPDQKFVEELTALIKNLKNYE